MYIKWRLETTTHISIIWLIYQSLPLIFSYFHPNMHYFGAYLKKSKYSFIIQTLKMLKYSHLCIIFKNENNHIEFHYSL